MGRDEPQDLPVNPAESGNNPENGLANNEPEPEETIRTFGISLKDLRDLMRGNESELERQGGVYGVCQKLLSSDIDGLSSDPIKLQHRREVFGGNLIAPKPPKTFSRIMLDVVYDTPWLLFLTIVTLMNLSIWGLLMLSPADHHKTSTTTTIDEDSWIDDLAILISVLIVVFVTAVNDSIKERQFRRLKALQKQRYCTVTRGGRDEQARLRQQILMKDIVVGDICKIKYGDIVPADGLLLQSQDLFVDELSLTGDFKLVRKDEEEDLYLLAGNLLVLCMAAFHLPLASTNVIEGYGTMIVAAVGLSTVSVIKRGTDTEDDDDNSGKGIVLLEVLEGTSCETGAGDLESPVTSEEKVKKVQELSDEPCLERVFLGNSMRTHQWTERNKKNSIVQSRLCKLAEKYMTTGTGFTLVIIAAMCIRFSIVTYTIHEEIWNKVHVIRFVSMFSIGIALLSVAAPQGLQLAYTVALGNSMKKMLKDGLLVRDFDALERLATITSICCSKTGILTTNNMTVLETYFCGQHYEGGPKIEDIPTNIRKLFTDSFCVTSKSTPTPSQVLSPEVPYGLVQFTNKTEEALVGLFEKYKSDVLLSQPRNSKLSNGPFVVFPCNLGRKWTTTVFEVEGGGFRVFVKGASEVVLKMCSRILVRNGKVAEAKELDELGMQTLTAEVIEPWEITGLRTIACAFKDYSQDEGEPDWADLEEITSDLTCFILVALEDPLRSEVPDQVKKCQKAGITIRMITGENLNTAKAIARKCGIISPSDRSLILDSKEFNTRVYGRKVGKDVEQNSLDSIWPRLRILAGCNSTDKYNLVSGIVDSKIHKGHEIVGVSGRGPKDVEPLKKADIGFAMGLSGTDMANEASDITLNDDSFSSIVRALQWGSLILDNISKLIQFQVTISSVVLIVSFVGACVIDKSPFEVVHLVWINLIMDILASIALTTEIPISGHPLSQPFDLYEHRLISLKMKVNIVGQVLYQISVIFVLMFAGPQLFDFQDGKLDQSPTVHFTMIFNTFVLMSMCNEINARKVHAELNVFERIYENKEFCLIWALTAAIQVLMVQYGGRMCSTVPLTWKQWTTCLCFGAGTFVCHQLLTASYSCISAYIEWKKSNEETEIPPAGEESQQRKSIEVHDATAGDATATTSSQ